MNTMEMSNRALNSQSERSRWPALATRMGSPDIVNSGTKTLTLGQKIDRWMVNEGYRRMCAPLYSLFVSYSNPSTVSSVYSYYCICWCSDSASSIIL